MFDPICGRYPDTTAADPWPVLRVAPGLYDCASEQPGVWRRVDLRGRVSACSCRRVEWKARRCYHLAEVQRQAPALEAQYQAAPMRAA